MSPGSRTENYPAYAHTGLRENPGKNLNQSLMLAGNEFQSLGRAIVKEDEYEEVRWDGIVSIVSWRERVFRLWWEERQDTRTLRFWAVFLSTLPSQWYLLPLHLTVVPPPKQMSHQQSASHSCQLSRRQTASKIRYSLSTFPLLISHAKNGAFGYRSSTESYPAFAHIGLRENPGKNLNQVTCPDRDSNPGHLVSRPDALTVIPQRISAQTALNESALVRSRRALFTARRNEEEDTSERHRHAIGRGEGNNHSVTYLYQSTLIKRAANICIPLVSCEPVRRAQTLCRSVIEDFTLRKKHWAYGAIPSNDQLPWKRLPTTELLQCIRQGQSHLQLQAGAWVGLATLSEGERRRNKGMTFDVLVL
ncbi:hypothetical protein ANN_05747 [Periplaneta americana]|uniref:Uncharacterized protein n=1 Tax=Periplaneta americana TaxID=6978 RepID=A0ABQ8TDF4_PERAM|nr:hypothetical protein ANN_05747 [Periplaneta americana]